MNQSPHSPPPERVLYSLPQPDPHRQILRRTANIIGGGLLLLQLVMMILYEGLSSVFGLLDPQMFGAGLQSLIAESVDMASYLLSFWLVTVFLVLRIGIPGNVAFPLRLPRASLCIPALGIVLGTSVAGSMLSMMVANVMHSLTGLTPYMPDLPLPTGLAANIMYVLNLVLIPAVFEELLFRGAILQSLRRFGDGFALAVSSILFSLLHGNLVQGPNTLLMGLVMGYFVLRTGSLWTGILMHMLNNGLAVALMYLAEGKTEEQIQLFDFAFTSGCLLFGLAGLAYMILRHGGLFRIPDSEFPMTAGRKYLELFTSVAMVGFVVFQLLMIAMYVE